MSGPDEATRPRRQARRRAWVAAAVVAALIAAAILVLVRLQPSDPEPVVARPAPAATPSPSPSPTTPGPCEEQTDRPFKPKQITIPGIIRNAKVLALPRDGNNVPSVPPVGAKQVFAWDRPPGIRPGEPKGNVLLNAHTWPDGSALGNEMLRELKKGERIIVRNGDVELCFEVDKKVEVLASGGFPEYYDREGPHQLALLVCSGRRLGPGNWTHRTIWFARPAPA
jgi:hypothetical protein